jgi:hypothetical protein
LVLHSRQRCQNLVRLVLIGAKNGCAAGMEFPESGTVPVANPGAPFKTCTMVHTQTIFARLREGHARSLSTVLTHKYSAPEGSKTSAVRL